MKNRKLIIITSDDWYFLSHRLPVGEAGRRAKFETIVVTGPGNRGRDVWSLGYRHIVLPELDRNKTSFLSRIKAVHAMGKILIEEKPTIVFAVSLRFGILAKLASKIYKKCPFIILMPGLGFLYSSKRMLVRMSLPVFNFIIKRVIKDDLTDVVVQNQDNMLFFRQRIGIKINRLHLIRGSGVALRDLDECVMPKGEVIVTLAGRMLWSKGVSQFVDAARILRAQGVQVRMVLVGVPDAANPDYVPSELLVEWAEEEIIEWWGFCDDMNSIWKATSIAVFPTWYGEGIPKALLEAASFARPVIATDVPGCRDVIEHDVNGLLIKPRSAKALAAAIVKYIEDPQLVDRTRLSLHKSLENNFDLEVVTNDTASLFEMILSRSPKHG